MKILVIAPTPFFADRGTHIRILEEALALEKIGHKITIATYHIGKDIDRSVKTKIDLRRIRRLLFWYKKLEAGPDWQKILLDIMLIRKAFYLARTQKPDIIHCHLHEGTLIGWIVKKCLFWRKMKLVADFHGSLTKEMVSHSYLSGGLLKSIFKRVEWQIDNLGDSAIASSWELTEEIKKIRKRGDVQTILDGVNISHYEKLPTKEFLKKEFELPLNKVIVTYTGALIINKGISYFLDSIPKVIEKNKEVFFVIAGFPIEETEKYIKEKKLENFVRIISPLSYFELPKILMASDIAIDPKDSSTNQASGKILQYMAAGLPVVCFNRENNRKYLEDGAFYAKEISANALADSIILAIEEKEEAKFKGIKNKERAKIFSWDLSAEKISKLYEKIS
jgi:glycosyltransferase involved in cell wall biosynthesis